MRVILGRGDPTTSWDDMYSKKKNLNGLRRLLNERRKLVESNVECDKIRLKPEGKKIVINEFLRMIKNSHVS